MGLLVTVGTGVGGRGSGGGSNGARLFWFKNVGDATATVSLKKSNATSPTVTVEKSSDGRNWEEWGESSTTGIEATIPVGGRLYVRGVDNETYCTYESPTAYNNKFSVTGSNVTVNGDVRQLMDKDETELVSGEHTLDGLFAGCERLVAAKLKGWSSISANIFHGCDNLAMAPIAKTVTTIYARAFYGCGLTEVFIPASVTNIDPSCFTNCRLLESVVVSKGNSVYDSRGNCNAVIETYGKELIIGIPTTVIPSSVTVIGEHAFDSCVFPTQEIVFPAGLTAIKAYAFARCDGLEMVDLGDTRVTSIGDGAFIKSEIKGFSASMDLLSIGDNAFDQTVNMETFRCGVRVPPTLGYDVFNDSGTRTETGHVKIYVPRSEVDAYKAASGWSDYADYIEEI